MPGLTAASTWMRPLKTRSESGSLNERSRPDTTPALIESYSPNGLPTMYASLPMRIAPGLPSVAGWSPAGTLAGARTAMSVSGCELATVAVVVVPSAKVSVIVLAFATTWRAVSTRPLSLTTTPLPSPPWGLAGASLAPGLGSAGGAALASVPGGVDAAAPSAGRSVWIRTSDGRIAAKTSSEVAGPGVCEARTRSTVSATSRCVSAGLPGNRTP